MFRKLEPWERRCRNRTLVLCIVGIVAVIVFHILQPHPNYSPWAIASDAFMIPGTILLGLALLHVGHYCGFFDLVLYTASWTLSAFLPKSDTPEERLKRSRSFPEYVREKNENRLYPIFYPIFGVGMTVVSIILGLLK